jgi:hypothetical protein
VRARVSGEPEATPPSPPRVLVDLASLEKVDLVSRSRARPSFRRVGPTHSLSANRPHHAALADNDRSALLTIGRLARESRLVLCTYAEFEGAGSPDAWRGTWRALLGEVPVTWIEPALDRVSLGDDVFRDGAQSGALARLCARLKVGDVQAEALPGTGAPSDAAVPEGTTGADAPTSPRPPAPHDLDRFRELAARVQGHHLADLFHLWSAERAGCGYWLTLDPALGPFLREWVEPGLRHPLRCDAVLPNHLLSRIGIQDRDSLAGAGARVVELTPRPEQD